MKSGSHPLICNTCFLLLSRRWETTAYPHSSVYAEKQFKHINNVFFSTSKRLVRVPFMMCLMLQNDNNKSNTFRKLSHRSPIINQIMYAVAEQIMSPWCANVLWHRCSMLYGDCDWVEALKAQNRPFPSYHHWDRRSDFTGKPMCACMCESMSVLVCVCVCASADSKISHLPSVHTLWHSQNSSRNGLPKSSAERCFHWER